MASKELRQYVANVENAINTYGATTEYIEALVQASNVAIKTENDIKYGLTITSKAKRFTEQIIEQQTGVGIWEFERHCQKNDLKFEILDKYYEILKIESEHIFESFILYMEKDRSYEKRFYLPRRKTLKIVVDDLQLSCYNVA